MQNRTFVRLYEQARTQPTPAKAFVNNAAKVTKRSPIAVRKWLSGSTVPDREVQLKLSEYYGIPAEELFPRV